MPNLSFGIKITIFFLGTLDSLHLGCLALSALAMLVRGCVDNFSDLYHPLTFPPYFLLPGTMTLLPDCERHVYPLPVTRTKRYTFFINSYYSLLHYW